MKKYLLLLFALFFTIASPADGNDRGCTRPGQLMLADPFILEHEGWYYIYGTEDADGIVVYRSRDLKNWSRRCGKAKKSLALHKDDVWGKRMFWAPEVYKHGDKFIMTYSSEEHICCAEADSPCGPFTQKVQRPYLPDEKGIDASIFTDDDGKAYIYWVRFDRGNIIWVAELSSDLMEIKRETARKLIECEEGTWEKRMGNIAEGDYRITVVHRNVPNMVGQITSIVATAHINIDNMVNKSRKYMAYTVLDLDHEPTEEVIARINAIDDVIRVRLIK